MSFAPLGAPPVCVTACRSSGRHVSASSSSSAAAAAASAAPPSAASSRNLVHDKKGCTGVWQKFEVVTVTDRTWVWECPSCQAEHEHVEEHDAPSRPSRGSLASSSRFVCVYERDVLRVVCVCRRSHGRVCVCVLPLHTFFESPLAFSRIRVVVGLP